MAITQKNLSVLSEILDVNFETNPVVILVVNSSSKVYMI